MPLEAQSKLLRVLQEREIQRLGSSETIQWTFAWWRRPIPTCWRGFVKASSARTCTIVSRGSSDDTAAGQRCGDIPLLVDHFLTKICRNEGIPPKHVTPETKERLRASVARQCPPVGNTLEMAVALSGDRETLGPADLGPAPPASKRSRRKRRRPMLCRNPCTSMPPWAISSDPFWSRPWSEPAEKDGRRGTARLKAHHPDHETARSAKLECSAGTGRLARQPRAPSGASRGMPRPCKGAA